MVDSAHPLVDEEPLPWPFLRPEHLPNLEAASFVAANATVVGWVELYPAVSIWYGAVVRGDVERIVIGTRTNIQDGAILHGDPGTPTLLAENITVGHRAVIHSAQIEAGCMIGIGSVILNGVTIGAGSMVGAGAVVTKSVPPRSVVMGVPAQVVREVSDQEAADLVAHAYRYEFLARQHALQF